MTAELQPPDIETRIAILKKKAESLNIALDPWVIEFLADRIRNNVRRLEGALMRVASYKSLSDREITREVIENLLRDIFQEQARRAVTIEQIQRKVAEHFDVRLADMTSKRRPANIAFPAAGSHVPLAGADQLLPQRHRRRIRRQGPRHRHSCLQIGQTPDRRG